MGNSTQIGDMTDSESKVEGNMETGTASPDHKSTTIVAMGKRKKNENTKPGDTSKHWHWQRKMRISVV